MVPLEESVMTREALKLEAILKLSRMLGVSLRTIDVLENAMAALEEFLDAQASSVYEVDWETGQLFFRLARGSQAGHLVGRSIRVGEGVAGRVALEGQSRIVNRAEEEAGFFDGFDKITGFRTESMLVAPLLAQGRVIGVIQLLNKRSRQPFTQDDLDLALIMAGQIGVALENARLYGRLEEKQQQTAEELARTQKQLIHTERQAALSGLASGIAHQIRNPSMSIGGFARRILDKTPPELAQIKRYAQVIVDENARLEELVRRVVFLLSINPHPEPTDPAEVVARATSQAEGLEITWDLPLFPRLPLDGGLLTAVFLELFKNSKEAGASQVRLEGAVLGEQVRLVIRDNGSGFEPDALTSGLDAFFSSKAHSLGLGLAVVQRVMDTHGGSIRLDNPEDGGAQVTLNLPMAPPQV
jgi:signal transduction histidine kinase